MFNHIKTKIKDCECFAKECEKWKQDCELQMKQINCIMNQNASIMKTCKEIMDRNQNTHKQNSNSCHELNLDASQFTEPGTPPTPIIDCSESQNIITSVSLSPSLAHTTDNNDEYATPIKKAVSIREDKNTTKKIAFDSDDDDDDEENMLNRLLNTHDDKESNPPKIKRKRQRIKK